MRASAIVLSAVVPLPSSLGTSEDFGIVRLLSKVAACRLESTHKSFPFLDQAARLYAAISFVSLYNNVTEVPVATPTQEILLLPL